MVIGDPSAPCCTPLAAGESLGYERKKADPIPTAKQLLDSRSNGSRGIEWKYERGYEREGKKGGKKGGREGGGERNRDNDIYYALWNAVP